MNHSHTSGVRAAHDLYHTGTIRPVRTATFTRPVMVDDDAFQARLRIASRTMPWSQLRLLLLLHLEKEPIGDVVCVSLHKLCSITGEGRVVTREHLTSLSRSGWLEYSEEAGYLAVTLTQGGGR